MSFKRFWWKLSTTTLLSLRISCKPAEAKQKDRGNNWLAEKDKTNATERLKNLEIFRTEWLCLMKHTWVHRPTAVVATLISLLPCNDSFRYESSFRSKFSEIVLDLLLITALTIMSKWLHLEVHLGDFLWRGNRVKWVVVAFMSKNLVSNNFMW